MKKTKKSKLFKRLFILLFLAIFITLYSFSNKMLIDIGVSEYSGMLSTASYFAINKTLSDGTDFSSVIQLEKDSSNNITAITTDAYKFNVISANLAKYVGEYFSIELKKGVEVPIGVFTGIRIFSGFGKKVKMPLITVSSVQCDIVSSFEEAGINQVKHSLYVNILPEVYVVTRFSTKDLKGSISVLVYETIIVGKIPEVYLTSSVFSSQKVV